jgi:hypothetical protein
MRLVRVRTGWRCAVAVCMLVGAAAGMQPMAWASGEAPTRPREWRIQELSWVRVAPAEAGAGARNAHPANVSPEVVRRVLGSVGVAFKGRTETLFSNDELDDRGNPIVAALAAAGPGNDVELLSTARRHGNFFSTPYGVTTRLFVTEAGLNLIVHDTRLDFYHAYRATQVLPAFQYGSRRTPGSAVLSTSLGQTVRPDWLVFSLQAPLPAPSLGAPAAAAGPSTPPAAQPAPAARRDDRFYEEQEQRLRGLQRLREQNLLTEEEFQRKRREILQLL